MKRTTGNDTPKEILLEIIKRLLEADDLDFLDKLGKSDLEGLVVAIRQRGGCQVRCPEK